MPLALTPVEAGSGLTRRELVVPDVRVSPVPDGDQLRTAVDVLVDVVRLVRVDVDQRFLRWRRKCVRRSDMKSPLSLAVTSRIGGAPLGLQETQMILPVAGSRSTSPGSVRRRGFSYRPVEQ